MTVDENEKILNLVSITFILFTILYIVASFIEKGKRLDHHDN
jgi:hypothetical protein